MEQTIEAPVKQVFKFDAEGWDDIDISPKIDQPKLCKIEDPTCEACQ